MSGNKVHVLIVEDEPAILELISYTVKSAGWQPVLAESAAAAWHIFQRMTPDVILLDWMLPDGSGINVLKRLREDRERKHCPVIMLTARGEEEDRVQGLDTGADDYVVKPFSPKELVARINAVLRRKAPDKATTLLKLGMVELDPDRRTVTVKGILVEMGRREFALLRFLMTNPGRVFSRGQLLDKVWHEQPDVEERTVDVHVLRVRKALGDAESMLKTVRGVGYVLSDRES